MNFGERAEKLTISRVGKSSRSSMFAVTRDKQVIIGKGYG